MVKALTDRLAEAWAEWQHRQVRKNQARNVNERWLAPNLG